MQPTPKGAEFTGPVAGVKQNYKTLKCQGLVLFLGKMLFHLDKILAISEDMPSVFVELSDTTRMFTLALLTDVKRWDFRYEGEKLTDAQWDTAQALIDLAHEEILQSMLVGMVTLYGGDSPPGGWLICDGSEVSRSEYQDLFYVIGETFGNGDGSTTFNLPDLRDAFPRGVSSSTSIGDTGGEAQHTLTIAEMPSHTHVEGIATSVLINGGLEAPAASAVPSVGATGSTGGDNPHNNLPPFLVMSFIIKV